jgi:hypothetical protein
MKVCVRSAFAVACELVVVCSPGLLRAQSATRLDSTIAIARQIDSLATVRTLLSIRDPSLRSVVQTPGNAVVWQIVQNTQRITASIELPAPSPLSWRVAASQKVDGDLSTFTSPDLLTIGSETTFEANMSFGGIVETIAQKRALTARDRGANCSVLWAGRIPDELASCDVAAVARDVETFEAPRQSSGSREDDFETLRRDRNVILPRSTNYIVSVKASAGPQDHNYLDPNSLAGLTNREWATAVSAGAGSFIGKARRVFPVLKYTRQKAVKPMKPQQICTPLAVSPASLACREVRIGAPRIKTSSVVDGELRIVPKGRITITPHVAYDFESEVVGAELPVWVRQNTTEDFTAGISIGWRSDERKKAIISLFAGRAISTKIFEPVRRQRKRP